MFQEHWSCVTDSNCLKLPYKRRHHLQCLRSKNGGPAENQTLAIRVKASCAITTPQAQTNIQIVKDQLLQNYRHKKTHSFGVGYLSFNACSTYDNNPSCEFLIALALIATVVVVTANIFNPLKVTPKN